MKNIVTKTILQTIQQKHYFRSLHFRQSFRVVDENGQFSSSYSSMSWKLL